MPDATQIPQLTSEQPQAIRADAVPSPEVDPALMEPSAIVGSQFTFEQICAFGLAMGWGDRPLSFVVRNWMESRPAFDIQEILNLPR